MKTGVQQRERGGNGKGLLSVVTEAGYLRK